MTPEEKEKAYDEAIERASKLRVQNPFDTVSQMMEYLFPELRESEDERIRKVQLDYWHSVGGKEWHGVPVQEVIAWLEKQEEKKPAEWNDSDEERFQHSLLAIKTSQFYTEEDRYELVDWLKSLKQRMEEQL